MAICGESTGVRAGANSQCKGPEASVCMMENKQATVFIAE